MADIHKKKNGALPEESIFTAEKAQTAQQRAAQAKEEKAKKRAQRRAENAALRKSIREQLGGENRAFRFTCIAVLTVVVLIGVLVLVANFGTADGWDEKLGVTYYLNSADVPDMPDEGIAAVVNEVCYAKNGGLLVHLTFANGEGTTQHPTRLSLTIRNENDEVVASTSASTIPEKYFINSGGYKTFDLRIPKKYVKIADDPLSTLSFEVTVESEEYTSLEGDSFD